MRDSIASATRPVSPDPSNLESRISNLDSSLQRRPFRRIAPSWPARLRRKSLEDKHERPGTPSALDGGMHILLGGLFGLVLGAIGTVIISAVTGRPITLRSLIAGAIGGLVG